jgi:hypothetical protein
MYSIHCPGARRADPKDRICTYTINEDGLQEQGKIIAKQRVEAQMAIIRDVQGDLEEVQAVFYSHDVPWQFVGHEYVSLSPRRHVKLWLIDGSRVYADGSERSAYRCCGSGRV